MAATSKARGSAGRLMLAASFIALAGVSSADAREPVRTEQELIERVRAAIGDKDLDSISELVNWEGAAPIRRRIVTFQINYALGRPVKSVGLEPLPEAALQEVEAQGRLRANMPVSHRLRVVFDEPGESGSQPASVFLIGKIDGAYRIALVVRKKRGGED
jgi:hypothetical protein